MMWGALAAALVRAWVGKGRRGARKQANGRGGKTMKNIAGLLNVYITYPTERKTYATKAAQ
jgi:hypothetical protein